MTNYYLSVKLLNSVVDPDQDPLHETMKRIRYGSRYNIKNIKKIIRIYKNKSRGPIKSMIRIHFFPDPDLRIRIQIKNTAFKPVNVLITPSEVKVPGDLSLECFGTSLNSFAILGVPGESLSGPEGRKG